MQVNCPKCKSEVDYQLGESEFCSECGYDLAALFNEKDDTHQEMADGNIVPESDDISFMQESISHDFFKEMEMSLDEMGSNMETEEELTDFLSEEFGDFDDFSKQSDFEKEMNLSVDDFDNHDLTCDVKSFFNHLNKDDFSFQPESECDCVKIEYNKNLFFLSNVESVIKLRITPLQDDLKNLLLFMEIKQQGNDFSRQIPIKELIKKNRPFVVAIPYNPQKSSGRLAITFYVGCKVNQEFSYYKFVAEHKVYDSETSSNQIVISGTISTNIHASGASDINMHNPLDNLLPNSRGTSVNDLIDKLNELTPNYEVQVLTKTIWQPENIWINGNSYETERLLLEFEGKKIFLFSKKQLVLGRDAANVDLIVRKGMGKLSLREYPNNTVSRKHAEFLYCEDAVKIFDYSSYGTYIDGRKPDSAGIPLQDNALIEFGDICWNMHIQKCRHRFPHNICETCNAHQIKSLSFKRVDGEPEYYLFVWQCCELGRVIEELTDWSVFTRNNKFFIRVPGQNFYYLRPGQTIEANNKKIHVKYFNQD